MTPETIRVRCPKCSGTAHILILELAGRMAAHETGCRWRGPMTEAARAEAEVLERAAVRYRASARALRVTSRPDLVISPRSILAREDCAAVREQEARWLRSLVRGRR